MKKPADKNAFAASGLTLKTLLPTGILIIAIIAVLSALSVLELNNVYGRVISATTDRFDSEARIAVETVIGSLKANHQRYLDGLVSEEESYEIAKTIVRNARYSSAPGKTDDGYFWADMANGYCAVHYNPANEGAMRWDAQDQEGTHFIRNFIKLGDEGGGFSDFYFGKPGDESGS
ncbi:MAG: cache domain-containing protein, partial [Oscillospiraceae bacterium]|nr:cache domain-containing protein [Oscillospiraceae bacterium]